MLQNITCERTSPIIGIRINVSFETCDPPGQVEPNQSQIASDSSHPEQNIGAFRIPVDDWRHGFRQLCSSIFFDASH